MSVSISSNSQIKYNYKEYRCPKCFLVPFINLSNINNKLYMSIKCITNDNHNDSKPFDEMEKMCTYPISNNTCINCESENKENKKLSNIFFYCPKCLKFFCSKHGEIHNLKEKHEIIFIIKILIVFVLNTMEKVLLVIVQIIIKIIVLIVIIIMKIIK